MFAALVKAAIFYWVFLQIRKLLKSNSVFAGKKHSSAHERAHYGYRQQDSYKNTQQQSYKYNDNENVIEADYRVID